MTERRRKIKQAKAIYRSCVALLDVLLVIAVLAFVLRFSITFPLSLVLNVLGWAALICGIIFRWRKNKLICCPLCGVFLREEFIDAPTFTCLGCGKDVDNSKA